MSDLINLFLNLDTYLALVIEQLGVWVYVLMFLVVCLETGLVVTPFLPSDPLLFVAGALSALGDLNLGVLLLLFVAAALLGDAANYKLGGLIGPRLFSGRIPFLNPHHLVQTHEFYDQYGLMTIMYARWLPMLRTLAPFVAGMGAMSYRTFLRYNALAVTVWVLFNLGIGYFFGNVPFVKDNFGLVVLAIIPLSFLPALFNYLHRRAAHKHSLSQRS